MTFQNCIQCHYFLCIHSNNGLIRKSHYLSTNPIKGVVITRTHSALRMPTPTHTYTHLRTPTHTHVHPHTPAD